MGTFYATAGYQLNFQQLQIPRSFYQSSLLYVNHQLIFPQGNLSKKR
jgi:hypothetical protein